MGSNKAFLDFQGKPLVLHVLHALQAVFETTFIVAPFSEPMHAFGVPVIPDVFPNRGPLGGMHAALIATQTDFVFFAPCDAPLIRPIHISMIADAAGNGPAVASFRNVVQPLLCVLPKHCLPLLEKTLMSEDFSVRHFLEAVGAIQIDIPEDGATNTRFPLININTPAEYEKMRWMGAQPIYA
jgi:molybdopterin-guanine dinucleotide biosynthesis protein A